MTTLSHPLFRQKADRTTLKRTEELPSYDRRRMLLRLGDARKIDASPSSTQGSIVEQTELKEGTSPPVEGPSQQWCWGVTN